MTKSKIKLVLQSQRFIEAAREHGADGDTSAADELMGRLARTPPVPRAKPQKRTKKAQPKAGT